MLMRALSGSGGGFNGLTFVTKNNNSFTASGLTVGKRYICITNQCFTVGSGGTTLSSGATENMTPSVCYNYWGSYYFTTTVHDITATSTTVVFAPGSNAPNGNYYTAVYEVL